MATQKQAEKALEQFEEQLSGRKHVVGLGVVPLDEAGDKRDLAVGVYVKKKIPLSKLSSKDRVPESLSIDSRGSKIAVPVRVIEQGVVKLEPAEELPER